MATYTSPLQLYNGQRAYFTRNRLCLMAAHKEIAEAGLTDALKLLSGASPSGKARIRYLAALGHPYGRNRALKRRRLGGSQRGKAIGTGQLPHLPIGNISYRLKRALRLMPLSGEGLQQFGLGAPGIEYAQYILGDRGTRKMVGRGFQRQIRQNWRARNKAFIDHFSAIQARTNP